MCDSRWCLRVGETGVWARSRYRACSVENHMRRTRARVGTIELRRESDLRNDLRGMRNERQIAALLRWWRFLPRSRLESWTLRERDVASKGTAALRQSTVSRAARRCENANSLRRARSLAAQRCVRSWRARCDAVLSQKSASARERRRHTYALFEERERERERFERESGCDFL